MYGSIIIRKIHSVNEYLRIFRIMLEEDIGLDIIDRIKEIAEQRNITSAELGEILGLKKGPLTDWKSGQSKPRLEHIVKICEIFGVSSDYLIFGNNADAAISNEAAEVMDLWNLLSPPDKAIIKAEMYIRSGRVEPMRKQTNLNPEAIKKAK